MIGAILSRHIAALMIPLMIVSAAVVLQGIPLPRLLLWLFPIGLAGAVVWTRLWLQSTIAMVRIEDGAASFHTFSDMLAERGAEWLRLTDVQIEPGVCRATLGLSPQTFRDRDWPDLSELANHLLLAYHQSDGGASRPIDSI